MIIVNISESVAKWMPPFSKGAAGLCVFPFVFLLKRIQGVERECMLVHEKVHWIRQRNWLCIPWYIMYGISLKFRLEEEVLAYKTEYDYKKANGLYVSKDLIAKHLSSDTYNHMISYEDAKKITDSWV